MSDDALNVIYKAVVMAKVLHAIPASWGDYTAASDRQILDALSLYVVAFVLSITATTILPWLNLKIFEKLFTVVLHNDNHELSYIYILADRRYNSYCLRPN